MSRTVAVFAAHPDDEILGCGGTIAKHAALGDIVHVVILAEGITSRKEHDKAGLSELAKAAHRANMALGAKSVSLHGFPDNRMDSLDRLDVIQVIEGFVSKFKPEIVYTHGPGDVNVDHRRVFEGVMTACRPTPGQPVKSILSFEIPSSTEWMLPGMAAPFSPTWFIDITEVLETKLKSLEVYETEMRPWPHPRSIKAVEHLARWRGATVGVEAAEAFVLCRHRG